MDYEQCPERLCERGNLRGALFELAANNSKGINRGWF